MKERPGLAGSRHRAIGPNQSETSSPNAERIKASVDRMQADLKQSDRGDYHSRKHLYRCTAEATLLAREAHSDPEVCAEVARLYEKIIRQKFPEKKIDLGIAVLVRRADTPEMRAKAGKMGRGMACLRPLDLDTVDELADYLMQCGGIEKLIKAGKRRSVLSPTELIIECTTEQLTEALAQAGRTIRLEVRFGNAVRGEMIRATLISIDLDDPSASTEAEEDDRGE